MLYSFERATDLPWTSQFRLTHFPSGCTDSEQDMPNKINSFTLNKIVLQIILTELGKAKNGEF